jgi:DNA polymerase III alpha subunit
MKIISARRIDVQPVYDLSVSHEDHSFSHSSGVILHNCGVVINNSPIDSFLPLTTVKSGDRVTSFTKDAVESAGGLKMDFLVVNSIKDISNTINLIQHRHCPELTQKGSRIIDGKKVVVVT